MEVVSESKFLIKCVACHAIFLACSHELNSCGICADNSLSVCPLCKGRTMVSVDGKIQKGITEVPISFKVLNI